MNSTDFYNKIHRYYQGSFDFVTPFLHEGKEYTALAEFHSHVDKYVLLKKAQIWAADSHEFCVFQTYNDFFCLDNFSNLTRLLEEFMEPQLVRKGNPDVEKDHMYTYLSLVIICDKGVSADAIKAAKRYSFTKYYKMYTRGYSEAHIILVDLNSEKVYTNRAGHEMKKLYKKVIKDSHKNPATTQ